MGSVSPGANRGPNLDGLWGTEWRLSKGVVAGL